MRTYQHPQRPRQFSGPNFYWKSIGLLQWQRRFKDGQMQIHNGTGWTESVITREQMIEMVNSGAAVRFEPETQNTPTS